MPLSSHHRPQGRRLTFVDMYAEAEARIHRPVRVKDRASAHVHGTMCDDQGCDPLA